MNTQDYLSNYYQNYDEEGRLLSRHGMVEYVTTMKYIEKYLQPGMHIMEIVLMDLFTDRFTILLRSVCLIQKPLIPSPIHGIFLNSIEKRISIT